jgi:antitoxin ParD1/3/4
MNINLGAQWEHFIGIYVKSGRYLSASEVGREGLRLLQEREQLRQARLEQLRNELDKGIEQIDRGEFAEFNEQAIKKHIRHVKVRGRQRLAKGKPANKS